MTRKGWQSTGRISIFLLNATDDTDSFGIMYWSACIPLLYVQCGLKSPLIKKEKEIFLIFKEIQMGSVAKSYMRKGFLICEEVCKYSAIYEEAIRHIHV